MEAVSSHFLYYSLTILIIYGQQMQRILRPRPPRYFVRVRIQISRLRRIRTRRNRHTLGGDGPAASETPSQLAQPAESSRECAPARLLVRLPPRSCLYSVSKCHVARRLRMGHDLLDPGVGRPPAAAMRSRGAPRQCRDTASRQEILIERDRWPHPSGGPGRALARRIDGHARRQSLAYPSPTRRGRPATRPSPPQPAHRSSRSVRCIPSRLPSRGCSARAVRRTAHIWRPERSAGRERRSLPHAGRS